MGLIIERFAWLEGACGCRRGETVDQTMFSSATWANDVLEVRVTIDVRDGVRVELVSRPGRPDSRRHDLFSVQYYREHGTLEGLRDAARARRPPRDWGRHLDQLAADLRTHGDGLLRGDLSLLDRLDG